MPARRLRGWVLLGLADPQAAGPLAHALQHRGLASVPAFDAGQVVSLLDNPQRQSFTVVLLDRRLPLATPPLDQLTDLVAAVRARSAAAILTLGRAESGDERGADAYLPLNTPVDAIVAGTTTLASTRRERSPGVRHWGQLQLDPSTWEARWGSTLVRLTIHQFHLLDTLVTARGTTVSANLLATALYGTALPSDLERIRAHIARLRHRLQVASPAAADVLLTVRGKGYRLILAPEPSEPEGGRGRQVVEHS